jgi:hypothetical protein
MNKCFSAPAPPEIFTGKGRTPMRGAVQRLALGVDRSEAPERVLACVFDEFAKTNDDVTLQASRTLPADCEARRST